MSHEPTYLPHEHAEPDAWHRHSTDEGNPQQEHTSRVNIRSLLVLFSFMLVFLVASVAITAVYFMQHTTGMREKLYETTELAAQQLEYRAGADSALEQYAWQDASAGVVKIPVSKAMEKVVQTYAEGSRDDG